MEEKAWRRQEDRNRLQRSFYRVFDRSSIESAIMKLSQTRQGSFEVEYLGEGAHFRAYRYRKQVESLYLAVNIAKPQFFDSLSTHSASEWVDWLFQIKQIDFQEVTLIPPFEILAKKNGSKKWKVGMEHRQSELAIVLPYGPELIHMASPSWQPIDDIINSFQVRLFEVGFKILDSIQGRSWEGIPFITDFSDLKPAN